MTKFTHGSFLTACFWIFCSLALFTLALAGAEAGSERESGEWLLVNDDFNETRHEGAFVQAGLNFHVMGGRETLEVRTYDPDTDSWSTGAASPILLHHMQAVELDGLIYVIGAMTGNFPSEDPVENVYIYDPLDDSWIVGPELPQERLRGSSGAAVHNGLIYCISGNENGHLGPHSTLVDVYDPATAGVTALADIPHARDHVFATLHGDQIYVIGGRQSGDGENVTLGPNIPEVDVYDIAANSWATLPTESDLEPPRSAAATALLDGEIVIAGGESDAQSGAHAETQAFDPVTGQWRSLADMITPRHATQAIVSNGGFHVVGGSPVQGGPGGSQLPLEALYLDGQTSPTGEALSAGSVDAPANVQFDSTIENVPLSHVGGNQAVVITSVEVIGSAAFTLVELFPGPIVIAPGASTEVAIEFDPSSTGPSEANLVITDGKGDVTTVLLDANGNGSEPTEVLFRINAGGDQVAANDGGPDWSTDTLGSPSPYLVAGGEETGSFPVQGVEASVPASTPTEIFETERWDPPEKPEMLWQFPVAEGTPVEIRLYLMNGWGGTSEPGERIFDISIDGETVFSGIDLSAQAGHQIATVRSFQTVSDGVLDIEFIHDIENPLINGIEIVSIGEQPDVLSATPSSLNFGNVDIGTAESQSVTLRNLGGDDDPTITISDISIDNALFSTDLSAGLALEPGDQLTAQVTFSPVSVGSENGSLSINHTGANSPVTVSLAGTGFNPDATTISFSSQTITSLTNPTQMEFGPDGRLYVSEQKGLIYAFDIERDDDSGDYSVLDVEVIGEIQTIPNHNDDGSPFSSTQRNVTGMITTGTADNPVLYVTSSDPRIDDADADTNSGILSRLTWTGSEWQKVDLVRSLPRSEHDHLPNGMALDADAGVLYIAMGGHTNMGAPSFSFGNLPEYAYSAAVISVDLNAIGETTYDIPTLKGEVFGGQFGANQAILVENGPVQVHAPGFRNAYDLLLASTGKLYTWDNGPNAGWGGLPINEGPAGNCTNAVNESGSANHPDGLHYIDVPGYYGGHPNPTRANRDNTFEGASPIPEGMGNPVECNFLDPGVDDSSLTTNEASTNGLAEYTASNFGGAMTGNIIATSWNGNVLRVMLHSSGDAVVGQENLFTSLSGPLGVTAQGDEDPFPGTIWIGQYFNGSISVFEPNDFVECDPDNLDPDDTSPNGYTYGDLIDNGLDPCNPAQVPPDFDADFVSDINDEDIDGDGIPNIDDIFDFDPENGRGNSLPHRISWSSDAISDLGGMSDWNAPGFTGHMVHPTEAVSIFDQFDPNKLIPGGAAGIFTVEEVTAGDAWSDLNDQENAFHFGVDTASDTGVFTVRTRVVSPFAGFTPENFQSMGVFIGNGDQDNYIKLVASANDGFGGLEFALEEAGSFDGQSINAPILGADHVDLYLVIDPDPVALTVTASYVVTTDGVRGEREDAGDPVSIPQAWLTDETNGLAVGIISTSAGASPFPASWRFVEVYEGDGEFFPEPGSEGILSADPDSLDFGSVPVDGESSLVLDLITEGDVGDADITVTSASVDGADVFATDFESELVIPAGDQAPLSVTFEPDSTGSFQAEIIIAHDGQNSPLVVLLTGEGSANGATVTLGDLEQTYDGEPKPVTVTTDPPDLVVVVTYDGGEMPPTDAGDYAVIATVDDPDWSGSASGTLIISPAPQSIDFADIDDRSVDDPLEFALVATADSGLPVTYEVLSGPASVDGEILELNGEIGTVTIEATQAGDDNWLVADPVQQSFEVIAGVAASIAINDGDGQVGAVGEPLPVSPSVTVSDQLGNPVSGIEVVFEVLSGGGTSTGNTPVTDSEGIAQVGSWTLGDESVDQELMAEVPGLDGSPVIFTAQLGNSADLAISIELEFIATDNRGHYKVDVLNLGPTDVEGALVGSMMGEGTSEIEWTCISETGASCEPSGSGDLAELVDLQSGTSVTYLIEATLDQAALEEGITSSVLVEPPEDINDPDPDNNFDEVVTRAGIFSDRFESLPDRSRIY